MRQGRVNVFALSIMLFLASMTPLFFQTNQLTASQFEKNVQPLPPLEGSGLISMVKQFSTMMLIGMFVQKQLVKIGYTNRGMQTTPFEPLTSWLKPTARLTFVTLRA